MPFANLRGKNNEILALFGMREQVSKEYQFMCGNIFTAGNQCLYEGGKTVSVI